jgi:hypothetical protein
MADAETSAADVTSLERLAAELSARGFGTKVNTPDGQVPSLAVVNPWAPSLDEVVIAGSGWFWWSWAERITATSDVSEAAGVIARVLAAGSSST